MCSVRKSWLNIVNHSNCVVQPHYVLETAVVSKLVQYYDIPSLSWLCGQWLPIRIQSWIFFPFIVLSPSFMCGQRMTIHPSMRLGRTRSPSDSPFSLTDIIPLFNYLMPSSRPSSLYFHSHCLPSYIVLLCLPSYIVLLYSLDMPIPLQPSVLDFLWDPPPLFISPPPWLFSPKCWMLMQVISPLLLLNMHNRQPHDT